MTTHRTRHHSHGLRSHILITGIMAMAIASFTGTAFAQGQGKGGGGNGGGGGNTPPPAAADPAIAFGIGSSLTVIDKDGSNMHSIVTGALFGPPRAIWSPDLDGDPNNGYQGTIAFMVATDDWFSANIWLCDVRVIDGVPTALRLRQVANGAWIIGGLSWSPDLDPETHGYQGVLAYVTAGDDPDTDPDSIVGISVAWDGDEVDPSTGEVPLSEAIFTDAVNTPWIDDVAWSRDGTRLVFRSIGGDVRGLVILDDLNDPTPRLVVSPDDVGGSPVSSEWSRTGNTIVFRANSRLWLVDADDPSTTLTRIDINGLSPTWSPDDSAIAYHGIHGGGNRTKILKYDLATGNITILAEKKHTNLRYPHWRPF